MKRICFVTTISMTIKAFILENAKYLSNEANYDVTLICNNDDEFAKTLPSNIRFVGVPMRRGISFSGFISLWKLYKIFRKERFDLVQYSTPNASLYASIAAAAAGVKRRVYAQWGIAYVGFSGIKKKIFRLIEKLVCYLSTNIQPDSFGNLKFGVEEGLYEETKGEVIGYGSACGVDFTRFDINLKTVWRDEIRKKYHLENTFVFAFVGRVDRDKGLNELLDSFLRFSEEKARLLVIGAEDKTETLDQDIYKRSKIDKRIIYTGQVEEIEKYFAAMDCFILPSYREGFGNVVIEAEAMGVPVVVTNIPGPSEAMMEGQTGWVIPKKDKEALYQRMEQIYRNPVRAKQLGENGVMFVKERFDCITLFKKVMENKERLLSSD